MEPASTTVGGRSQWPPAGVVFDCDGVLVDSEPIHARATTEWAAGLGITLSSNFLHDLVGMTVAQQVALIVRETSHDPYKSYQAREKHFWSVADEIGPMLGAGTVARRLKADGTRIAIASSGSHRYLQHVIDLLELGDVIDGYIGAEDVTHPKPHPEPYTKAVAMLGLRPQSCVAIEDSATGTASASAAGLKVIKLDAATPTSSGYAEGMATAADFNGVAGLLYGNCRRLKENSRTDGLDD